MKRLLVFSLLSILLFASCNNYSNIELKNVNLSEVKLISTSKAIVDVEYTVNNTAKVGLILESIDGFLTRNRVNFAQITLIKTDTIAPACQSTNRARFQIELLDPRGVLRTSKGGRKAIKLKNVPLESLTNRF